MPLYGKIVVIKRNGTDGTHFPLTASSCLFGRKKECDIRIQLPQVSKEHCKIEVNENKEATLFNLSSVTPTQLNGIDVQSPTYLKHGDVLTVIDRSFRFEYPPLSFPRKRLSRSQEKETLQVLHVKQEEQELLHPQDSENRNSQISEKKHEWKSQILNSEKKRSKEHTTGQYATSESSYKIHQSERKNEMSPFSKLYELMKYEDRVKNHEENAVSTQQKGYSPPKYGNCMPQSTDKRYVANQTKTEAGIWNGISNSEDNKSQEITSMVSNPVPFDGNSSRRSSGRRLSTSLRSYATKQKEGSEDATLLNICNTEENEAEQSKVINSNTNKGFRATRRSTKYLPETCCIVSLDSTDTRYLEKAVEQTTGKDNADIRAKVTETTESDKNVLLKPESKRGNFQSHSHLYTRNARSSSKCRLQQEELDSLVEMKSHSGTLSEIEEYMRICMEGHESENLVENRCSKIMESNTVMTVKPIQALKETKMEISANYSPKDGISRNVASPDHSSKSRSPRMSTEQNKGSSDRSSFIKHITTEELLIIPTDPSGTGNIKPVQIHDATVGRDWPQEEQGEIKQSAVKGNDQNGDTENNVPVSSNLSESDHENDVEIPAEAVSNPSRPLTKKSDIKKSPQKRKSTEIDLLTQPLGKRKRVSFGGHLSPELFDKRLPPNSPLKRGAIPARLSLPFGNSPRAVLKKASGLRQSVTKEQHKTILMKMAASPPARRSPAPSPPARRSPAPSPPARRSPAPSPPARRSPAPSPPARRSPAPSPPARRPPAPSPPARRSPAPSPPARRSPAPSPPARRSPAPSPPARRSPAPSPPARRSPAPSPPARRSPAPSPPARRSPAPSPPARRSPAPSPPARRSPAPSPPARRSPAPSPPARRSPAPSPPSDFSCDIPQRKGRFSVSRVACSSSEEQDPIAEVKTPESIGPVSKTACSVRRSKKFAPRRSSLHRGGTVDAIHSKRRSGASEANLMVAKSWAEVVKQGVPKLQIKTTRTKCNFKRRTPKKISTKSSKNNVSVLKTPIRKVKGHFTTGHANSPAPILIGKAHSTIMNSAAHVPKVMFNYPVNQQHNLNESFTGMTEMFKTPLKGEQKNSLSSSQRTTPEITSEMHSTGQSGEASAAPFCISNQQGVCSQDIVSPFLNKMPQISSLGQDDFQMTPRETIGSLEVVVRKNNSLISVGETAAVEHENPEQNSETIEGLSAVKRILRTPKQKPETTEALPGLRRILRTPKQKPETVEALSGVKRILRTPKQRTEPAEALSGIKRILRTPKQKTEPVEALSGVKRILRTPKQKMEPVEALSGVKRILRTPKQKMEPVEALSGVKRILRTPKQKIEPVEALSGVKRIFRTPKQKMEAVEALSGVKRLLRTPKQKMEPVEALSGVKRLLRTPKQETEPTEVFSGIKQLLRTPKEYLDPVADDIICSELIKTPGETLMGSFKKNHKQIIQPVGNYTDETPKEKVILEDLEGIQRQLTRKQRSKHVEDLIGISQLFKTPRQKFLPVDDHLGLQKLMAECKQRGLSPEIDYTGVKEMLDTAGGHKGEILDSANIMEEDNGPCVNSRNKLESLENEAESKEAKLEASFEVKFPFTVQRKDHNCDAKFEDNPLNELESEAKCMTEKCQLDRTDSLNENKTDSVKEPDANLSPKDKEMTEPLAPGRRTRKRKADESSTTAEQTRKIQKHTRNLRRAKSDKYIKSNDHFEQTIAASSAYESHMPVTENVTKISSGEKSRKLSTETNGNVQNKDFETSVESIDNSMHKRNRRGKTAPLKTEAEILNIAINEYKSESTKCITSNICKIEGLENNTAEVKENAVRRGKGRKVRFLHEENNSMAPEDKCALGDNSGTPEEERSTFSETSTSSTKENTSRRSKKKVSVLPQQLCFSFSEEKHTEICGDTDKKGIKLSFENITLTKDDPSVVSSSFFQGKNVQEIQVEESPNETQKVPLETIQTSAVHSPLKRQDAAKGNLPRRGRSRQTISHEICTDYDSKQSAEMKKQNVVVTSEENKPERGRGRRTAPTFQIPLPLEDITLAKEGPKTVIISSAQRECSLQQIQKEKNPNETPKEAVESNQTPTEHHPARKQKVAKENPPRRGRSKQAISHETSTEYDSKKAAEVMGVTINENQPKRVGRKRVVPVLQEETLAKEEPITYSFSSAKGDVLKQIKNEEPNESQKVPREVVQTPAEHSPLRRQKEAKEYLPRRGRRKQVISHEPSTEYYSKQAAEIIDHNIVVTKEDKQTKRVRGKRVVPVFQTPLLREDNASAKEGPKTDSLNSAQGECLLQQIQSEANASKTQEMLMESVEVSPEHNPPKRFKIAKEDPPRRGRRKAVHQETVTECEKKQADVIKDENMVVKNADSTKKSESKRGRGRKIPPVSQALFSPLKNNSSILSPSAKSKSEVGQPSGVLETAATVSENLSCRGRRRKTDDIPVTGSAPASKKSKLLNKDKEEKMPKNFQDLTEGNVGKKGRREQLILYETSTISNAQLGNSESDKTLHLETPFKKRNQSKRNREEKNVASELLPSLKVSITLPSSSSDKDRTASENSRTLTENVEKRKQAKCSRNNKIVEGTRSMRRNNKAIEEVFQEKDLEKKTLLNEKQYRRGRKKVDTFEQTVSLKEKDVLTAGSCAASEDQQEVLDNAASSKKVASYSRGQKFHKGKIMPKDIDQSYTPQNDQNSDSEFSAQMSKKNSSNRGRRKQAKNDSETSTTTSDIAGGFIAEYKSTKSKKEKAESTALRKGKKIKEDHSTAMPEPTAETEGRTRGSRRTRK